MDAAALVVRAGNCRIRAVDRVTTVDGARRAIFIVELVLARFVIKDALFDVRGSPKRVWKKPAKVRKKVGKKSKETII